MPGSISGAGGPCLVSAVLRSACCLGAAGPAGDHIPSYYSMCVCALEGSLPCLGDRFILGDTCLSQEGRRVPGCDYLSCTVYHQCLEWMPAFGTFCCLLWEDLPNHFHTNTVDSSRPDAAFWIAAAQRRRHCPTFATAHSFHRYPPPAAP